MSTGPLPPDGDPKRLPGLWIICVLNGLAGMFCLTASFSMTPLAALIEVALALVNFAVAGVLYLRLRGAWIGALVLLGIVTSWNTVTGLLRRHPNPFDIAVALLVPLAIASYLYVRRNQFGRADVRRPRVLSAPGISALAIVLVLGGGVLLILTVDDARRSFPALERQITVPPEQENGFLLAEQMRAKWPLADDEQLYDVWDGMPQPGAAPDAEWLAGARALVQKYADCLAQVPELTAKPHFVEVPLLKGTARMERGMGFLPFTRLLARLLTISAHLQALDGHWDGALAESQLTVRLGLMVDKESTSLIQSLVGIAVAQIGLRSLQSVAADVPDAELLRAHITQPLPEEEFRKGYNLGLAQEFQVTIGLFEEVGRSGPRAVAEAVGTEERGATRPGFFERSMRVLPLLKMNMTYNLLGRVMQTAVIQGDTYAPPLPDALDKAGDAKGIIQAVGLLHFARNPVGDILVVMLLPAHERMVQEYFSTIAQARQTQILIALRCCQLEHGKLPESLDVLAPEYLKAVPVDPFTGKPFGYEPGGKEPRIWSVGADQRTDPPGKIEGDDVVVELTFAKG